MEKKTACPGEAFLAGGRNKSVLKGRAFFNRQPKRHTPSRPPAEKGRFWDRDYFAPERKRYDKSRPF
jgi:hypothetical protein